MFIRKMVNNIINIFIGWYRKITKKNSDFAKYRQFICSTCHHREKYAGMN